MKKLFTVLTVAVLSLSSSFASPSDCADDNAPHARQGAPFPSSAEIEKSRQQLAEIQNMIRLLPFCGEKARGNQEALVAIEKMKKIGASKQFLQQAFEELLTLKEADRTPEQMNAILLRIFAQQQAQHASPGPLTTPYAKEVEAIGNKLQAVVHRFVAAVEKSPALTDKIDDVDDETMKVIQRTLVQLMADAIGEKFETPESIIPAKKASKKLLMVLCGPLGLKPNPDMPVADLMDLVSKHLKDKYGV